MTKKEILLAIAIFIIIFSALTFVVFLIVNTEPTATNPTNSDSNITQATPKGLAKEDIPTTGNDTVLLTNVETRIRIINEYNKNLFTAKKNLLIMFGSWCPNCEEEIVEIEKIINHYKDNKNVNIFVIAHEFNDSDYPLSGIISLVENDVNYGDFEVWVDFNRIIRASIDPAANSVPISYVVDKNGKVLEKHDASLTLEKAQEMLK